MSDASRFARRSNPAAVKTKKSVSLQIRIFLKLEPDSGDSGLTLRELEVLTCTWLTRLLTLLHTRVTTEK